MSKIFKKIYFLIVSSILLNLFSISCCLGQVPKNWSDHDVYRPDPILFLHGFAQGNPQTWNKVVDKIKQYFSAYYSGYNNDPTILQATQFPYLEVIDFGSELIDRNSSIDTYKVGDRYVNTGQKNSGDFGWSDIVASEIEKLRQNYHNTDNSSQKIILIAHSMGGLAAREYLKNYSFANQKVKKLIMIGTPNLGSQWATGAVFFNRNRRWGVYIPLYGWISPSQIDNMDRFLENRKLIDIDGDAVWDMDATSSGSGFVSGLNSNYPNDIDHFAIIGKHFSVHNLGDAVVSLNSQSGLGILSLKNSAEIEALHWNEPEVAISGDNPLLKFLDPAPYMNIMFPDVTKVSEIYEPSVHIKGYVFQEYLPADSKLHLNVLRTDDMAPILDEYRENSIKPTTAWIPNNPDAPVAEYDEVINFPSAGTYQITCSVKNPAGNESGIEIIFVKVILSTTASVIVHCHNPEGKEINSIQGISESNYVKIYDGDTFRGYGAHNAGSHNQPISIPIGAHTIKAEFNSMTLEQDIALNPNETKVLTFTFPRVEFDLNRILNHHLSTSVTASHDVRWLGNVTSKLYLYLGETNPLGYWAEIWDNPEIQTIEHGTLNNWIFKSWVEVRFVCTLSQPQTFNFTASLVTDLTPNSFIANLTYSHNASADNGIIPVGTYGNFEGIGGSFLTLDVPTDIVNPNFNRWIVQGIIPDCSGYYANVVLSTQAGNPETLIPGSRWNNYPQPQPPGYYGRWISASPSYYKNLIISATIPLETWNQGYFNNSIFSDFKMSSVPYDLLGTGIE